MNIGMLTVRNEIDVIEEFLDDVEKYFDTIVVMDDSTDGTYEAIARRSCVKYLVKYSDPYDPNGRRTDGQKQHLFEHINKTYGFGNWITNLNADAFFGADPNKTIEIAEQEDAGLVTWGCWTFYPHKNDIPDWEFNKAQWEAKPIRRRLQYATDSAWPEHLQFKNAEGQYFDPTEHSRVVPRGPMGMEASIRPDLFHYPLRSPKQIVDRRNDRALTGFRTPEWYQSIIDSGGFINENFVHFNNMKIIEV